ncbi:unnamed protein product [Somion occarium]|uniref:Uncharacterized protein n=1 Tax=Somion occarium TaxID=3059160 RepID=A0ABP1CP71_9APHY
MSVAPELPTTLNDREALRLPDGNDLYLQLKLNTCHVFPGDVDPVRFRQALAKTLARFPHAAGRLRHDEQGWRIDLTNSPVPVEVVEDRKRDEILPSDIRHSVVHKSEDVQNFHIPVSLEGAVMGEDVPLITFKLTKLTKTGETVLGLSWNHVLGDATTLKILMQTLSQYYQGLPPPPSPTFHKRTWPQPPSDKEGEALYEQYVPHMLKSYPLADVIAKYTAEALTSSMVDFTFTKAQQDKLLALANKQRAQNGRDEAAVKVTQQDALSAYLITLHNRCLDKPIHNAMYMMNYRTRSEDENALYRHPRNAGNCIYLPTFDVSASHSLHDLARTIRNNIVKARTTEFLETYLMLNGNAQKDALETGRFHIYPAESVVLINSLAKDDLGRTAHFGFPGKSQYYTDVSWERMFRIFPANPVKKDDGRWESNEGSVVVAFRVKTELKDKMTAMYEDDMRSLAHDQPLGSEMSLPSGKLSWLVRNIVWVLRQRFRSKE